MAANNSAAADTGMLEDRLSERFSEIAELTRLLAEAQRENQVLKDHVEWLHAVVPHLRNSSRLKFLNRWQDSTTLATLHRRKLFDARAYLAANPDVGRAGVDPLHHYLNHGLREGRPRG